MERKCNWLGTVPRASDKSTGYTGNSWHHLACIFIGIAFSMTKIQIWVLMHEGHMQKHERETHTSEVAINGVLLTSYMAIRPWYDSSPSLKDKAKRSPEASQAIFSIV